MTRLRLNSRIVSNYRRDRRRMRSVERRLQREIKLSTRKGNR